MGEGGGVKLQKSRLERAREELEQCRNLPMVPSETEVFLPFLAQEEELLRRGPARAAPD